MADEVIYISTPVPPLIIGEQAVTSVTIFSSNVSTIDAVAIIRAGVETDRDNLEKMSNALDAGDAASVATSEAYTDAGLDLKTDLTAFNAFKAQSINGEEYFSLGVNATDGQFNTWLSARTTYNTTGYASRTAPTTGKGVYFPGGQYVLTGRTIETLGTAESILGDGDVSRITGASVLINSSNSSLSNVLLEDSTLNMGPKSDGSRPIVPSIENVTLTNGNFTYTATANGSSPSSARIHNLKVLRPPAGSVGATFSGGDLNLVQSIFNETLDGSNNGYCAYFSNLGQMISTACVYKGTTVIFGQRSEQSVESYWRANIFSNQGSDTLAVTTVTNNAGVARFTIAGRVNITSWTDAGYRFTPGPNTTQPQVNLSITSAAIGETCNQLTVTPLSGSPVDLLSTGVVCSSSTQFYADVVANINAGTLSHGFQANNNGNQIQIIPVIIGTTYSWAHLTFSVTGLFAFSDVTNMLEVLTATNHTFVVGQYIWVEGTATGTGTTPSDVAWGYDHCHEVRWVNGTNKFGVGMQVRAIAAPGQATIQAAHYEGMRENGLSGFSNSSYNVSQIIIGNCGADWFEAMTYDHVPIAYVSADSGNYLNERPSFWVKSRGKAIYVNDQFLTPNYFNKVRISGGYNLIFGSGTRIKVACYIDWMANPYLQPARIELNVATRGRFGENFGDVEIGGFPAGFVRYGMFGVAGSDDPGTEYWAAKVPVFAPLVNQRVVVYNTIVNSPMIGLTMTGPTAFLPGLQTDRVGPPSNDLHIIPGTTASGVKLRPIANGTGDVNIDFSIQALGTGSINLMTNGNADTQFIVGNVTGAVNHWTFSGSTTGNALTVTASGSDTNIGMQFSTKGTSSGRLINGAGASQYRWNNTGIAFYNGTPAAQPTITGSRGGNAALASLLTGLASLSLIVDSTTV